MKQNTASLFTALINTIAQNHNVTPEDVMRSFNVTPSMAQTIMDKVVEDGGAFLRSISMQPVDELQGEKVSVGVSGGVAKRTAQGNDRAPSKIGALDNKGYQLHEIEFDGYINWKTIDQWAKFADFFERVMRAFRVAQGNSILMAGWFGETAEAATDITANPEHEDLAPGWLKQIRGWGDNYIDTEFTLGTNAAKNLDSMVSDAYSLIPNHLRDNSHVVIVDSTIQDSQRTAYFEEYGNRPTEKVMIGENRVVGTYGGLPAITAPFFAGKKNATDPTKRNGAFLITPLDNLAFYYQDSSIRRKTADAHERKRVEDYNYLNGGYVVEDFEKAVLVDNILPHE